MVSCAWHVPELKYVSPCCITLQWDNVGGDKSGGGNGPAGWSRRNVPRVLTFKETAPGQHRMWKIYWLTWVILIDLFIYLFRLPDLFKLLLCSPILQKNNNFCFVLFIISPCLKKGQEFEEYFLALDLCFEFIYNANCWN